MNEKLYEQGFELGKILKKDRNYIEAIIQMGTISVKNPKSIQKKVVELCTIAKKEIPLEFGNLTIENYNKIYPFLLGLNNGSI
ncbi:hypothetical protein FDB50_15440 [Clostridium botulinum]|uniref:Uncharacterized protein n=1 Tax=Clostridium botulinum TaxID=1491 RepID=A0A846K4V0_CLOBO|nr:hypothetical protein [Clostridium botulinum]NFN06097.1 hypothetical protein [Clostridium botulinum]NFN36433.1 hypothetical protein [Clostridium botulinum]